MNEKCVIFQGSPLKEDSLIPEYLELRLKMQLEPAFEGNDEALYLLIKKHQ
jgi:hypothetical protein